MPNEDREMFKNVTIEEIEEFMDNNKDYLEFMCESFDRFTRDREMILIDDLKKGGE